MRINIVHTPPFPVPLPAAGAVMLPILGAIIVGCAVKSFWDTIIDN